MAHSRQAHRRKIAKVRAEFCGAPWAIDVRAMGCLSSAVEAGDFATLRSLLSLGSAAYNAAVGAPVDAPTITRIIGNVAVIPVVGVLRDEVDYMVRWGGASSYQLIERDFAQALDNSQVKGIVFYHNSPGGSAIGCKRVADLIFESRGLKPIRAYVQGICASASYYMAAPTDRIESTADSLAGSIGTILPHMEMSGMLKEFGVGATVFTNVDSPKKSHGNVYEPLSDDARKTLQQFVDSYGRPFIEDVARYRGISADDVIAKFGQGDVLRADVARKQGIIDAVVDGFAESLDSISNSAGSALASKTTTTPVVSGNSQRRSVMNERIKAQLFALGLIDSLSASDAECKAAMNAWAKARGEQLPSDESQALAMLQAAPKAQTVVAETPTEKPAQGANNGANTAQKPVDEQGEARLEDLHAAAELFNEACGREAVTLKMVQEAHEQKLSPRAASKVWAKPLAEKEPSVPTTRVTVKGEGADRYAADVVDALVYKSSASLANSETPKLSDNAAEHVRKPLWAIAGECLQLAGNQNVDMYSDPESLAEQAMQMGVPGQRHTFYSAREGRQYISASGTPHSRPGDFPNILSNLANKFLDTIQLDDDYSYPLVSAVLPGGLKDFKPALMMNKGIVEELDEVQDAEAFKQLNLSEEVLSYIFLRRFGNKWGWTPVMIANDDLGAFVEGMIGLEEAWQVTQNRLVVDLFTSNPALLDGKNLFDNRDDTGTGTNKATNDNDIEANGGVPSDAQWEKMEEAYADIGGIGTGRRVRGTLNTIYVPTGDAHQEAVRTFAPLNIIGEGKQAATTANVGLYRGKVQIIPESELRVNSKLLWYGLRSPTRLNTATVVRGYFNGFGTAGRRERWYDPTNKTTWVSIEGRIATAIKNWRYAIRNKGEM